MFTYLLQYAVMQVLACALYQWKHSVVAIHGFALHVGFFVVLGGNLIAGIFAMGEKLF